MGHERYEYNAYRLYKIMHPIYEKWCKKMYKKDNVLMQSSRNHFEFGLVDFQI